jgi:hypothetical protein
MYLTPDPIQQAQIVILTTALQQQAKFLERIEKVDTGWWDAAAIEDAKKAISNALLQAGAVQ